eukprot:GFYU01018328.1.p1 GENE.GFYU01018328.1~~GFYU01018328.1.p1  ORF type:complete len:722 (-),score=150.12 GFYU01018328.1:441-2606(-)
MGAAPWGGCEYEISRQVFVRGMGLIFLIAFASVYTQAPGLYGQDGLNPVDKYLKRVHDAKGDHAFDVLPTVLLFAKQAGLHADHAFDILCILGMTFSTMVAAGWIFSPFVFAAWYCYLSIYLVGQRFLSFQWDILLLEAGFLTVLYAPLFPSFREDRRARPVPAVLWTLRWLLFKLMFMSGVVKIQANCNTWLDLTALEYHYATQCIPTPLAWYAHNMPAIIHRMSVAATLVIEIPMAFFVISPFRGMRHFAAFANIFLMVLIALTGNYTFFNALTALLCVPLIDDSFWSRVIPQPVSDDYEPSPIARDGDATHQGKVDNAKAQSKADGESASKGDGEGSEEGVYSRVMTWVGLLVSIAIIVACCHCMFKFTYDGMLTDAPFWSRMDLKYVVERSVFDEWVHESLFIAVQYSAYMLLGLMIVHFFWTFVEDSEYRIIRFGQAGHGLFLGCMASGMFICSLIPFSQIDSQLMTEFPKEWQEQITAAYHSSSQFHVSAGYGLFRRMTGVGVTSTDKWGRPLPVVARPEIVFEISNDAVNWVEYEFKYKPGDVDRSPPWVAPHQPRLDWQMWFAALSSYQHEPWIVALANKILLGSPAVASLMQPIPEEFKDSPPKFLRAQLYHYDFTLPSKGDGTTWWRRTLVREYLPPITGGDESLSGFLKHHGWPSKKVKIKKPVEGSIGDWVVEARAYNIHWYFITILFVSITWGLVNVRNTVRSKLKQD